MNAADLPPELARPATSGLIDAVRAIAQGPLAGRAYAIDRGAYPVDLLKQLAATGAMSAHLEKPDGSPGDYGLAILAMAEAAKVCGATGFMMWCQCVAGLYMQASGNPALTGERAGAPCARRDAWAAPACRNPMKSFAQIETLLLKATPVEGGYLVNGTLPWVSNLAPDHYFGAIAAVAADGASAAREMMFMLRCDAPGVTLKTCPEFSGMEGTGTFSVQLQGPVRRRATTSWPTRPSPPSPASGAASCCCNAASRPASSRAPSTACGRWRRNSATSTSSSKTGRPSCRPSSTRWRHAS